MDINHQDVRGQRFFVGYRERVDPSDLPLGQDLAQLDRRLKDDNAPILPSWPDFLSYSHGESIPSWGLSCARRHHGGLNLVKGEPVGYR
jgi:hypothetical protein